MLWTCTLSSFVFSLVYLCADVSALSTLGREFWGVMVGHHKHFKEGIFSIFTFNYDVKVNVTCDAHVRSDLLDDTRMIEFDRENKTKQYSLERHTTTEITITMDSEQRASKYVTSHYVVLKGNDDFGVSALYININDGISMYTLLPIRAYGTLFNVYLLKANQAVVFHSNIHDNNVTYSSMIPNLRKHQLTACMTDNFWNRKSLNVYQCEVTDKDEKESLRGRRVMSSHPIAVITSNCHSMSDVKKDCNLTYDSATDVLLPRKFAAKEFIAFDVGLGWNDVAHVSVMGFFYETQVKIYFTINMEFETFTLGENTFKEVPLKDQDFQFISASKEIQVYLVTQSTCVKDGGSPSFTMLIPNLLFFNRYLWSIPYNKTKCDHHFLILIKKPLEDYNFIFDNRSIVISDWTAVKGLSKWSGTHYNISPDADLHTLISGTNQPFACYLYGRGFIRSYLHFAGFMAARLGAYEREVHYDLCMANVTQKQYTCKITPMTPGDVIDNDCDGRIDEESSTKSNDDEDKEIGEDVISSTPEYFSKYSVPLTRPPPVIEQIVTTDTPAWNVDTTTQSPSEYNSMQLLLMILLLIPVVSVLLYYFMRTKETPTGVGEELEGPSQSRDAQSFGIYGEQQASRQHSTTEVAPQKAFASPGRTKSTYLH